MWDETTYSFSNFHGCTVEVWGLISNFTPHFMINVIAYPRCDLSETKLVKGDPERKRCMNEASHAPCSNVSQKYAHASHVVAFPYDQVLFHRYRRHSNSERSIPDEYKVISHKDPPRPYYLPIQRSTQKHVVILRVTHCINNHMHIGIQPTAFPASLPESYQNFMHLWWNGVFTFTLKWW